ncbi:MAG TPA: YdeI/OmpD-associated family protein [Kofleriaceae bacterium]|nr:YdeI/OmpD-associated family protein [Kofleriaceae bacterium]
MSSKHVGSTVPAPAMPGFVRSALEARKLTDAYRARPKYQQTEYLTWIHAAKLNDDKRKRLAQMLDELAAGNAFQGAPWSPPPPVTK